MNSPAQWTLGRDDPWAPADLTRLAGRIIAVRSARHPWNTFKGVVDVRDVAGDQEGPSVVVVINDATLAHPKTLPLTDAAIACLLAGDSEDEFELTVPQIETSHEP